MNESLDAAAATAAAGAGASTLCVWFIVYFAVYSSCSNCQMLVTFYAIKCSTQQKGEKKVKI